MDRVRIGTAVASVVATLVLWSGAWASGLQRPPGVDLDPDRGMTFSRLPGTTFDGKVFAPYRQVMRSAVMRPEVDPYRTLLEAPQYDPQTGKIRGFLSDQERVIQRHQDLSRRARKRRQDKSPAGVPHSAPVIPGHTGPAGVSQGDTEPPSWVRAASLERWSGLRASGIDVDFPFFLAPMVGLSHLAMRSVARGYRPEAARSLAFTEMLSTRRLPTERLGERPETSFGEDEADLVPQIVGNDEGFIAGSLRRLERMRPTAVDVNLGCPVSHAFQMDWGVALMGDMRRAEEVLTAVVRHSHVPVSAKIRTGLEDDPEYLLDFARMLQDVGVSWISLHPRTARSQRRGRARWEHIARVRDAVRVPVIGNGDVQTADDAFQLISETGCDGCDDRARRARAALDLLADRGAPRPRPTRRACR